MRDGIRDDEKQLVLESDCLVILTDADGTVQLTQADFIWDKITTVEQCNNLLVVHHLDKPMAAHPDDYQNHIASTTFAVCLIHNHLDLREWEDADFRCRGLSPI